MKKHTKASKRSTKKIPKLFWRRRRKKERQYGREKYKNLLEDENKKTGMQEIKTIWV